MLGFLYRLALYMLPVFMGNMESQLNEVAGKGAEGAALLAPTIAAASVGLFLPLVRTSATSPAGIKKTIDAWATGFSLIGLLAGLYAWHMLVATNLGAKMDAWVPDIHLLSLSRGGSLAILIYGASAVLSEIKVGTEK